MKNLINYIQEGLKVNSKSKINTSKKLLDKEINSIEELRDTLEEYFNVFSVFDSFTIKEIKNGEVRWKYNHFSRARVLTNKNIIFKFFDKNGINRIKLRIGMFHKNMLMQLLTRVSLNSNAFLENRLHGNSTGDSLSIGSNLFDFLMTIKKYTDEDNIIYKDKELIDLFGL